MSSLSSTLHDLRARLDGLGHPRGKGPRWLRNSQLRSAVEMAARIGFGARGFVYVSAGVLTLLAALDLKGDAVDSRGLLPILAEQPFGRLWLVLLGLGLCAFVLWRILQSVFNADNEDASISGWVARAGLALSGAVYALLAIGVFELLDEVGPESGAAEVAENQEKAAAVLTLPFGDGLLIGVGLVILAVGLGNIVFGATNDFGERLACSERLRRRVLPIARAGYVARGLAYLPLAAFIILAGWHARASEVESLSSSLDALEAQPGGSWLLGLTAIGLIAFGAFAFVEARFRHIRPPRDLTPF